MSTSVLENCIAKVLDTAVAYYRDEIITADAMRRMLMDIPEALHVEGEEKMDALTVITGTMCSDCLHFYKDGERYVDYDRVSGSDREIWQEKLKEEAICGFSICYDCFAKHYGRKPVGVELVMR